MKKLTPERIGRNDAYSGAGGFTYQHEVLRGSICDTNIWNYLKDVKKLALDETPRIGKKELRELQDSWGSLSQGLLSSLLIKAVATGSLPKSSGIYALRADEASDDLSWGPGAWTVGMIGARRSNDSLTLDIQLDEVLLRDEQTRRQAYGFAAGSVAMHCVPYDRGRRHKPKSVLVQSAPAMEFPFPEFDYVLERLKKDQFAELAQIKGSSAAVRAGIAALKEAHQAELVSLGY